VDAFARRLAATAIVVLATVTPSWAGEGSQHGLAGGPLKPGGPSAYHLGVGRVESTLDRGDTGAGTLAGPSVAQAADERGREAAPGGTKGDERDKSLSELNKELTNPVTSLWSLTSQFNNYRLANGKWNNNWQFQPVLPVSLTKDWNLITRPVFQLYNIVPHETSSGQFDTSVGLGDTILLGLLSPAHSGKWILGAGPTFIFPTATSDFTGQGKWQIGPGVVAGYLTDRFILGLFPQQWWSIGGDPDRPAVSQLNLQPIAALFFGDGWNVGYSGNILADWKAPSGDVWTVPVGLGVGKVLRLGRLPVKVQLSLQYMPVRPKNVGQEWNVQLLVAPVIPKLLKGTLFE